MSEAPNGNGARDSTAEAVLEDILGSDLRILFVGFNPGLRSGVVHHHFAGRGNQFWRLLAGAGLTPRLLHPEEDRLLLDWGLGLTNLVARATRSAANLSRAELRAGVPRLAKLVAACRPGIVAYVGKGVYTAAAGLNQAPWGSQQASLFGDALDVVLPSPSGLARLPFDEKLNHYRGLREVAYSRAGSLDSVRKALDEGPG